MTHVMGCGGPILIRILTGFWSFITIKHVKQQLYISFLIQDMFDIKK
jgi:hypothetical protein